VLAGLGRPPGRGKGHLRDGLPSRIREFHQKQLPQSWTEFHKDGSLLGQIRRPLDKVGVYVPGGAAPYPSSVLMNVLPAVIAGVSEIVLVTPPRENGECDERVLAAAALAGVQRVFRIGGVQAIAALAYGTESVPRVDKITGPGNRYVTMAKKQVYGQVDIDMLAGPSEIMILADDTARADWVAADLLSQAEHDPLSWAVLVTTDPELIEKVEAELEKQLASLPRAETARQSLAAQGRMVLAESLTEALTAVNHFAPEHLEILAREPLTTAAQVRHAGAIFAGPWSPEAAGDYTAGPNHVLPTGGTARFYSALGVEAFMKTTNLISLTEAGLSGIAEMTSQFARWEGFAAHARAVTIRRENA
jgi:histidinol dehydrogenase